MKEKEEPEDLNVAKVLTVEDLVGAKIRSLHAETLETSPIQGSNTLILISPEQGNARLGVKESLAYNASYLMRWALARHCRPATPKETSNCPIFKMHKLRLR